MNIAVLISGAGSNLQALIESCADGRVSGNICQVISNKAGAAGLDRAAAAGIPGQVVDHGAYNDRESFDAALVNAMAPQAPDLVILAGFMRILTPVFIGAFEGRLLNIHPSLLPKYPGLNTHQRALDAGDDAAGATVHFVTEELDGGPPILFARVPIEAGDTAEVLSQRVRVREHMLYPQAAAWFCEGRLELSGGRAVLDGETLPATGLDLDLV